MLGQIAAKIEADITEIKEAMVVHRDAIKQLQEIAHSLAVNTGAANPITQVIPTNGDNPKLHQLTSILGLIPRKESASILNPDTIKGLAETKQALDTLFPPSQADTFLAQVGARVLNKYADTLGKIDTGV